MSSFLSSLPRVAALILIKGCSALTRHWLGRYLVYFLNNYAYKKVNQLSPEIFQSLSRTKVSQALVTIQYL